MSTKCSIAEQHLLDSHMIFICPECGQENFTQQEWRKHLNTMHDYAKKTFRELNFKKVDDNHYECLDCLKWTSSGHQTTAVLQYHRFSHLPYSKIYRCRHCSASSFLRKRALVDHLQSVHIRLLNKSCQTARNNRAAIDHRDPKINKEFYMRFLCPLCGKLFERFQFWIQHLDSAHSSTSVDLRMHRIAGTKSYTCGDCSFIMKDGPTRSQLQRHHFSHLPYPSYFQCAFCYSRKAYKTELLLHFIKYHMADYLLYRSYIVLPDEWGGPAEMKAIRELRHLMEVASKRPKTDILQKALDDINLEDEAKSDVEKFNHEKALNQSLNSYEDVFIKQMKKPSSPKRPCIKFSEITHNDLESICQEMFEEIISYPSHEDLQSYMQRYIHYLCPECGDEFDDQPTWRCHVYDAHNLINAVDAKFRPLNSAKSIYLCLVCKQIQKTSKHADLRRHHFQHMPFQSYLKCTICSKTKSSKPKMIQHMENIHLLFIRQEIKVPYIADLNTSKVNAKRFQCLQCDKTYAVQSRFKNHCRMCPKGLTPLNVGKGDLSRNLKLLEHLKNANSRLDQMINQFSGDTKT
ncbi:uncharacterized protein LOC142220779 [Haematobia irritans]|uniref:uncharacterized protein LOC142220779 n=1 Tax=Haematobia irritans TaxID=7368 RepID=UPI003F4F97FC